MLTLGIPGDGVSAVMMGGLLIHGLSPGPSLFTKQPDVVGLIFTGLLFGAVGYGMVNGNFPASPLVLGLVLGHMFESEVRMALQASLGSVSIFFTRPVSCVVIVIAVIVVTKSVIDHHRKSTGEA